RLCNDVVIDGRDYTVEKYDLKRFRRKPLRVDGARSVFETTRVEHGLFLVDRNARYARGDGVRRARAHAAKFTRATGAELGIIVAGIPHSGIVIVDDGV